MRAPLEWIREYVALPDAVTVADIVGTYTRIGLEVEAVHTVEPTDGPLVLGRVLAIEDLTEFKKPIRFVTVDVGPGNGPDGSDEPRGIICGASNFVVGDSVVVALPGAVLPGGFRDRLPADLRQDLRRDDLFGQGVGHRYRARRHPGAGRTGPGCRRDRLGRKDSHRVR